MRISDWSSDVCSSDLPWSAVHPVRQVLCLLRSPVLQCLSIAHQNTVCWCVAIHTRAARSFQDRKSVVSGKSVSVRVDIGGRRILTKNNKRPILREHSRDKHNA